MDKLRFHPIPSPPVTGVKPPVKPASTGSFSTHLTKALDSSSSLTISKHAKDRMAERNIHISSAQWNEIEGKLQEAKTKGINDSLVLTKDAALIVSVKNKTVITAMDIGDTHNQIFSNIDGTIIL